MSEHCPVCSSSREIYFKSTVLNKYEINYLYCNNCGLLQTEKPYWLQEAYNNAISDADTGLVARNVAISRKLACIIFLLFGKEGKHLDVAGGYGMLTRMMRDIGFDFYWQDLYCENFLAKGFEGSTINKTFKSVTAFEVLEHVNNPIEFIQNSLNDSGASTIIFSTELFQGNPPNPRDWWYYSFETGQHISFYQLKTLKLVAEHLSLYFYSFKNIHMLSYEKLTNQLIWQFMTGRFSNFIYQYVKRNMASKTFADHKLMLSKYK